MRDRFHCYLLGDTVAEVLLLKVGKLQQWRFGLLQTLHYHLGQLHAILYGYQSRSMETWGQIDQKKLLRGLKLGKILFKVETPGDNKLSVCVPPLLLAIMVS